MDLINKEFYRTNVTLRITALWAFSEAFMGGILHGLKIPFAGLVLAFIASVCMTLIALGESNKGAVLKATLLVIAVKFILSPHTPPMAYVAVLIEGLAGELLFMNRRIVKPAAFILTLFCQLYSAFQHLLILTLVFGKGLWQSIDIFLNKITQSFVKDAVHYSLYIILIYLTCYLIAGIAGGFLNIHIINRVRSGNQANLLLQQLNDLPPVQDTFPEAAKKRKRFTVFFGALMVVMLVLSYLPFFSSSFSKYAIAELLIRGIIILLVWNYFITPLLRMQLQKWVARYKEKNNNSLQQVIALLPGIRVILQQSWQLSQQPTQWQRFKSFINNTVLLIVHHEQ
ncbi:hypothetical protein [Ferruginibacter sp.]